MRRAWPSPRISSFVRPLIFPGGDIGDLAVDGTVERSRDVRRAPALPEFRGFILEEGLEMETLRTVVTSMQQAAAEANVKLVTGGPKVVDEGTSRHGIFVNTYHLA